MKKLILVVLILTSIQLFSQQRNRGDIELNPKIGTAASNYYGEVRLENDPLSSVNLGIETDYFFNNRWSFHSGLLFQRMGSNVTSYYSEKINYITIPLNANWHFGSTRKWYLNFGPSAGFLISAEADIKQGSFDPSDFTFSNGTFDIKDSVNSFQLGLNFGIGYKIFINEMLSISIDYQGMTGLTNISNDNQYSIKNAYSSFNVGGVIKL
ncbi:porin family protein [Flavobacterium okayamense]|uniref:Outer membrane protein beta-barrel domain-containing protein n=1 Tax=Flavobacterium okayamense TaxID=2830782 RepID=A0ABN6I1L0_9FLAO|nr:porin family protein [Flavobacterium okayamense]BCY29192.1 hypothetical protein KK2020170_20600 [Flavobacterium okayamense]